MRGRTSPRDHPTARRTIHPRRDLTASLTDNEQRLRAIFNAAVDAIITIDKRGNIDSANESAERIFGYSPNELIGKNVSVLMPSPYREEHDGYLRRYIRTGEARIIGIGREVIAQRKDGRRIPVHLSISEVPLKRGRLFTAVIHDISERRRLEREVLEASTNEQERIGRELHDGVCQNLVGAALAASMLARRLATDSPAAAEEAERIAELVRQTATHARNLSHGLSPMDISGEGLTVALRKLAQQVTDTSGMRCTFVGGNDPSYEPATANHLYRIAQEAVNNAVRHAKATEVHVQLDNDGPDAVLTVRDDGRGFTRKIGQGLGLKTMAYRARVIGGTLAIERAGGGGTTVRCVFHSDQCPKGAEGERHGHSAPRASRQRRGNIKK